jgi:type VI secretion system protein ImpA
MSARLDGQALLEPISAEQPCGQNLDESPGGSPVLASLDALRLFGQAKSPEAPPDPEDRDREGEKAKPPIEWDRIRADALDGLATSKDLRFLAYLGTAVLRTDGLPDFALVLTTAASWLETYWPQVYPLIDEDAIARRNALNCLADPMAVVDRVWRLPLVSSRQHGRFSLRDIDILTGQATGAATEALPDEGAFRQAFAELPLDELKTLQDAATNATAALNAIDARMRGEGGPDVAPDFGPLSTQLAKLSRVCRDQLALRTGTEGAEAGTAGAAGSEGAGAMAVGAIKSRQDAVRALEAVAEFFRRNEPSSPIPLIVDRAKRLVSKDFLEVLGDIAPDAVSTARAAGGLRD